MKKAILLVIPMVFLLSGCTALNQGKVSSDGGVIKTVDGGKTWEQKSNVEGPKANVTVADSLALAIDPSESKNLYLGTRAMGLYRTSTGADSWTKLDYPPVKIYGLVVNPFNSQEIYATGVWENRGKIYKSTDGANSWKEIYTEPANGTVVTALAISRNNPQKLLVGTSTGAVIRTTDGGANWANVFRAEGPVTFIEFAYGSDEKVYFVIRGKGVLRSDDGGDSGKQLTIQTDNSRGMQIDVTDVYSIAMDPNLSDVVYLGTSNGLLRGIEFGEKWAKLNTLSNPERYPVTAIAVNPLNPNEITYAAAQAIYRSTNGGREWSTSQLNISSVVKILQYDPTNPDIIYGAIGAANTAK